MNDAINDAINDAPRGSYQADLLNGSARWSGGDLKGVAGKWRGRYAASRRSLLARINSNLAPLGAVARVELMLLPTDSGPKRWQSRLVVETNGGVTRIWRSL